jgi:uncharacterized membrane protein
MDAGASIGAGSGAGTATSAGKGLRIALAVSVALNLLIVGIVAGAMLRDGGQYGRIGEVDFGDFAEALSLEDRSALRRAFIARAPEMRDTRRQMREDFQDLLAAIRAEPFDAAALRAAMTGQAERMTQRLQLGQKLVMERLEAMSPEDRAEFATRLEDRLRLGPRGSVAR